MADRIDPYVSLAAWNCHNGNTARFTDPRLADLMQSYLMAGEPFGWPPWCTGLDCADGSVETNLYIPVVIRPGQCGWQWGAKAIQYNITAAADGTYNYPPYIQAEVYEDDLSTPLHVFTSQMSDIYASTATGSWAACQLNAPWAWSGSQTYTTPPASPAPGLLQVAPAKTHRDACVVLIVKNCIIACVTAQPVISSDTVASMA